MNKAEKYRLRKRAALIPPVIRIGKEGLKEGVMAEMERQLDSLELVKVRILKSARHIEAGDVINKVISETGAELVYRAGFTFAVYRKSEKKHPKRR